MDNSEKKARTFDIEEMMKLHQNRWQEVKKDDDNKEERPEPEEEHDVDKDDDEDDDDDFVGPPLPPDFGDNEEGEEDDDNNDKPKTKSKSFDDEGLSDDDEDDIGDNRYLELPTSHEIELKHGSKSITALALDPNGARLVTGSIDYEVKFWDFQGMDNTLQSFRSSRPVQSHSIKHLEYSSNGELILIISGACIIKLLDRDGTNKGESVKGDQYLLDKAKTKGHVAALTSGCWHPLERNIFVTTSSDTTARFWDVNKGLSEHRTLIKPRSAAGSFTSANCLAFTPVGDLLALGCVDGSILMWDTRRPFVNTTHTLRDAHQKQSDIASIRFSYNGYYLLSRGTDDSTMKLWDVRAIRNGAYKRNTSAIPVHAWSGLENNHSNTDCFFSPDDRLAITGCSVDERPKSEASGSIRCFDIASFEQTNLIDFGLRNSVIRSYWHPKLNQIVASSSNGSVRMLYDLKRSSRGALLCSFRQKRKKEADVFQLSKPQIITPNALPMFKEEKTKSKYVQFLKARKDPIKSKQPQKPLEGAGAGGRIGAPGKSFVSFIAKNIGVKNKIDDTLDPREAILRHAKDAEENPFWSGPAYKRTQPNTIFQSSTQDPAEMNPDGEDEIGEDGKPKKRKHVPI